MVLNVCIVSVYNFGFQSGFDFSWRRTQVSLQVGNNPMDEGTWSVSSLLPHREDNIPIGANVSVL
jgi:hypothetical protein